MHFTFNNAIIQSESEEMKTILDRLFSNPNSGSSGLDPYWDRICHTNYITWRQEQLYLSLKRLLDNTQKMLTAKRILITLSFFLSLFCFAIDKGASL